ncbi:MAG TPA: DNA internalization-related competence protein ComEC/Rec2 [Gemmataceae bacterium]|nr:DNA internalization-related competence protein ComEC/Rec2 [Gemmataceae bacterium]
MDSLLPRSIWRSPLVPAALALTAGILLDRHLSLPLPVSLIAAAVCLAAWFCARASAHHGLPLVYLALAGAAFGAAYHHYRRDVYAADDIFHYAKDEPAPAQLRGVLDEEPIRHRAPPNDPLSSRASDGDTVTVLRVQEIRYGGSWLSASGRVRVVGVESWPELHCGDAVEVVGQLVRAASPGNPGDFDFASYLRDRGIRTVLTARKTSQAVTRLERGWPTSVTGLLAVIRGRGQRVLHDTLPPHLEGLASALLLGEDSIMSRGDWDKYIRTGVIHVLAISGQHLVILAGFLWLVLPRLGVRQRHGAWIVALVVLGYALLAGGRPPALRSAVAVCAVCGALILRRRVLPANLFALSWVAVALANPTDLFATGCLLSFLSVAVLTWGTHAWWQRQVDPLDRLLDQTRPAWQRGLRRLGRRVFESYAVTLLIWLAITPLAASRYQMISPAGLLLGPPLVALTTVALFAGFLLLSAGTLFLPLTGPLAVVVQGSLAACELLVDVADRFSYSHIYIGAIGDWWLWLFYLGLLAVLTQEPLRRRWRWAGVAGLGWLCVGLAAGAARMPSDELRCTFLAVGHGGCTVIETPDGRTLLYDTGSLAGPEVTRRHIAPFLWHRGIRRIDEVIFSHADLDHFNGIVDLLDRFAIGQVTCTPTFADKPTPGVQLVVRVLRERCIPVRIVKAGDRLTAGDVALEVLHPPAAGPDGNENARSLVLLLRHAGHAILLTGDLEGKGLQRVLDELPPRRVEVMMAPHHGSHRTNTPELAQWARPSVVISCQGRPPPSREVRQRYRQIAAQVLDTHQHGAVTVRSHDSGLVVETFRTQERFAIRNDNRED